MTKDNHIHLSHPISAVLFCAVFLFRTGLKSFLTLPARERKENEKSIPRKEESGDARRKRQLDRDEQL